MAGEPHLGQSPVAYALDWDGRSFGPFESRDDAFRLARKLLILATPRLPFEMVIRPIYDPTMAIEEMS